MLKISETRITLRMALPQGEWLPDKASEYKKGKLYQILTALSGLGIV